MDSFFGSTKIHADPCGVKTNSVLKYFKCPAVKQRNVAWYGREFQDGIFELTGGQFYKFIYNSKLDSSVIWVTTSDEQPGGIFILLVLY